MIDAYISAFKHRYPQKQVKVSSFWDQKAHTLYFWVYIDGNRGDRPLSEQELMDATRMFNGGLDMVHVPKNNRGFSLQDRAVFR